MLSADIADLLPLAASFWERIDHAQRGLAVDFSWYRYDTLGSFCTLDRLLTGERRCLSRLIGEDPVLDVGCGDGHLALFLESLGCRVDAIDNPGTNANEMRGVRALQGALGSSIGIHEQDIDANFWPPGDRFYGVAFLFGVLYHLKNPFQVLENLARRARYAVLSTRIARFDPARTADIGSLPVAWLLEDSEVSGDSTNYWIFTAAGVRRLLDRAGWEILDSLETGNTAESDPVTDAGDARFFCLARRRNRLTNGDLLSGWHAPEGFTDWRWTERRFSVAFRAQPRESRLTLRFLYPPEMHARGGTLTIAATANGLPLPSRIYAEAGDHSYRATVPAAAEGRVVVEFTLDRWASPDSVDLRERGVAVSGVELR